MQGTDVYAGGTKRDPKNYGTFSDEDGGTIKAYNNYMEGTYTFIPYGASKYMLKGKETAVGDIDTKADFDAYVVDSRDTKVPATVKSYAGANAYNNFDTDKSVMYSYTADSPKAARDNVIAYAGRVQGGDFKWTFNNAADDTASSVNKKLQDALKTYKGGTGEVMEYSSSSNVILSSSTNVILSSSTNVILSSSSEGSSNSSSSKVVEPISSSGKEQGLAAFAKTMRDIYYDSPSSNLIFSAERVTKLKIFGINGRQIEVPVLKKMGDVHMLNLSALRAGIYIVRFTTGLGPSTVKIVKN